MRVRPLAPQPPEPADPSDIAELLEIWEVFRSLPSTSVPSRIGGDCGDKCLHGEPDHLDRSHPCTTGRSCQRLRRFQDLLYRPGIREMPGIQETYVACFGARNFFETATPMIERLEQGWKQ